MPERPSKAQRMATPEDYPVASSGSFPSGDYSYVLEIVMNMQNAMGKLTEAVESLKGQSQRQDDKLDQIGKDVHAGKVTVRVVGALIVGAAALLGWVITTYISAHGGK